MPALAEVLRLLAILFTSFSNQGFLSVPIARSECDGSGGEISQQDLVTHAAREASGVFAAGRGQVPAIPGKLALNALGELEASFAG